MKIITPRSVCEFNFLARYNALGKKFNRPLVGSLNHIVFINKDKTRYLQTMGPQNEPQTKQFGAKTSHNQSENRCTTDYEKYTTTTFEIYHTEGNHFQLCIIDRQIRFIYIESQNYTYEYLVWALKTTTGTNDDILYGVAVPRGNYNGQSNEAYWELVYIKTENELVEYFEYEFNVYYDYDMINRDSTRENEHIISNCGNFASEFKCNLPHKPQLGSKFQEKIKFDATKQVLINSSKLLKTLKKQCRDGGSRQFKNTRQSSRAANASRRKPCSHYTCRKRSVNVNDSQNMASKSSLLMHDIKELECGDINGLFDLMMANVYDSLLYSKLYPNHVQSQIYIDKYNGVYHFEFVILLEVKNTINQNNKVHKYGLTLVKGKNNNCYSVKCINPASIALTNIKLACSSNKQELFVHSMFGNSHKSYYDSLRTKNTFASLNWQLNNRIGLNNTGYSTNSDKTQVQNLLRKLQQVPKVDRNMFDKNTKYMEQDRKFTDNVKLQKLVLTPRSDVDVLIENGLNAVNFSKKSDTIGNNYKYWSISSTVGGTCGENVHNNIGTSKQHQQYV